MKRKLTTILLSGLFAGGVLAAEPKTPKIVVGIMVDQLRTDYLEQLRPYFGDKGFNRLMAEGVYLADVDFHGAAADAPTGTAIVYTGAWPVVNGVASAQTLDPDSRRSSPALSAAGKAGREYSPENLRVSTIADELLINNGTLSKIYSVGADPQVSVITSGHGGAAAIWFDDAGGRWASPLYYGSLPPIISNKNRTSPLASKVSSSSWRPLHPASHYSGGNLWNLGDFNYSFSGTGRDTNLRFKLSAPFNAEVTEAAIDLMKSMQSGSGQAPPGMLSLNYSLAPYTFDFDGDNRPELTDSYVRLDAELGRLIDSLNKEYGQGNYLLFLSSTGYASEPAIPDAAAKLPSGEITLKQAESLLNSYLSASFGNGDYVALIRGNKLYLDTKTASLRNIDLKKLREESKAFLMRMSGVSEVFTIDEILKGETARAKDMALGVDAKNAPDLFISFNPGWTVTDDNTSPSVSTTVRLASPSTPAFIMAPGLAPETVTTTVDATAIAPTVTSLLRIRPPNAAASKPLIFNK